MYGVPSGTTDKITQSSLRDFFLFYCCNPGTSCRATIIPSLTGRIKIKTNLSNAYIDALFKKLLKRHAVLKGFFEAFLPEVDVIDLFRMNAESYVQMQNPAALALASRMQRKFKERVGLALDFFQSLAKMPIDQDDKIFIAGFFSRYQPLTPEEAL
jgi:hypothetical protein